MDSVRFDRVEREPIKIELPKKKNNNSRLEVANDLNGLISSTPPSGFFMDALKNRMDVYFSDFLNSAPTCKKKY